jgi:acyl-CoA dehydrogenase
MNELTHIIEQTANGIFGDTVTHDMLAELQDGKLNAGLWQIIEDAGLTKVLLSEEAGGAGGTWLDAEVVLRACGRHCVPAPVGEAIAAYWILAEAGMSIPQDGILTWAPAHDQGDNVEVDRAPWLGEADHVLIWSKAGELLLFKTPKGLTHSQSMAGEPRYSGKLMKSEAVATAAVPDSLRNLGPIAIGALVRAVQMSGALDGALHISVQYATDRIQFGKPIARFQAIQQQLALMSGHVATSVRAAGMGCEALARDPATAGFDIAVAKVRNGEAVEISTSVSHQVHAAIGITFEYGLNFFSRRLWSWRDEYGSEGYWAEKIGAALVRDGGEALWPNITDGTLSL